MNLSHHHNTGEKRTTIGLPNQKIYNKTLLKWKNKSDIGLGCHDPNPWNMNLDT